MTLGAGWFAVKGHYRAAGHRCFTGMLLIDTEAAAELKGREVTIGAVACRVVGVEWPLPRAPRAGDLLGLMVERLSQEPFVWFDFDCPAGGGDMDLDPPRVPEPGETFRCAHCTGEHVASTEIGEWLTYTDPEMMEGVVQAGGRYPIA